MNLRAQIHRGVAVFAAAAFLIVSLPFGAGQAGMLATDQVVRQLSAQADRDRVGEFMDRDDVRRQMEELGVDPVEARARVGNLTNSEVAAIAGEIDRLPAGESAAGLIIGLGLLFVVVLIITDGLGYSNVFTFSDPASEPAAE
jgi:hypothetical protein